jgi:hypothetical protein
VIFLFFLVDPGLNRRHCPSICLIQTQSSSGPAAAQNTVRLGPV